MWRGTSKNARRTITASKIDALVDDLLEHEVQPQVALGIEETGARQHREEQSLHILRLLQAALFMVTWAFTLKNTVKIDKEICDSVQLLLGLRGALLGAGTDGEALEDLCDCVFAPVIQQLEGGGAGALLLEEQPEGLVGARERQPSLRHAAQQAAVRLGNAGAPGAVRDQGEDADAAGRRGLRQCKDVLGEKAGEAHGRGLPYAGKRKL
mmetsp:Transcript_17449/g.48277  ORF Transcript_17449/g.48277 Transcript_17449/m.48277 type:complete len:210 (+) Transcript_17449:313-942(+)